MPRINLLPWRAEERRRRKKEFLLGLLVAVVAAGALVGASKWVVQGWIENQRSRNALLRTEIAALDRQIAEILGLENQKERLLARMEIIEQLQRSRPEVVHLFDELVDAIPEGVYLTELRQQGMRLELKGAAQSSTRVSALMRNVDGSAWMRDPGLDILQAVTTGPNRTSQFTVFARQVSQSDEEGAR